MQVATSAWLGQVISDGRYTVTGKLGEGGMGIVYRATDHKLNTDVVVKAPRRSMLEDPEFVGRFSREIRALVRLSHPHIVKIVDVGEHDGLPFAVMQYLTGGSLDDRQPRDAEGRLLPMNAATLDHWLPDVAKALDFIHGQKFIHRDIKPANIFFDEHGNAYVGDFGVAKAMAAETERANTSLTATGMAIGTPDYMAPELIMGQACDGRVDQYALAITVYETLAAQLPFQGTTASALMVMHTSQEPASLQSMRPDLPTALAQAVHRGMAKDPRARYENCAAFARAVTQALPSVAADQVVFRRWIARGEVGKVGCPRCSRPIPLSAGNGGQKGRCPQCKSVLAVAEDLKTLRIIDDTTLATGSVSLPMKAVGGVDGGGSDGSFVATSSSGSQTGPVAQSSVDTLVGAVQGFVATSTTPATMPWLATAAALSLVGLAISPALVQWPGILLGVASAVALLMPSTWQNFKWSWPAAGVAGGAVALKLFGHDKLAAQMALTSFDAAGVAAVVALVSWSAFAERLRPRWWTMAAALISGWCIAGVIATEMASSIGLSTLQAGPLALAVIGLIQVLVLHACQLLPSSHDEQHGLARAAHLPGLDKAFHYIDGVTSRMRPRSWRVSNIPAEGWRWPTLLALLGVIVCVVMVSISKEPMMFGSLEGAVAWYRNIATAGVVVEALAIGALLTMASLTIGLHPRVAQSLGEVWPLFILPGATLAAAMACGVWRVGDMSTTVKSLTPTLVHGAAVIAAAWFARPLVGEPWTMATYRRMAIVCGVLCLVSYLGPTWISSSTARSSNIGFPISTPTTPSANPFDFQVPTRPPVPKKSSTTPSSTSTKSSSANSNNPFAPSKD